MQLNLKVIRENLHTMPEEERTRTLALLQTLGVSLEYKPKPQPKTPDSLSSYYLKRSTKCLTCNSTTHRWYHITNDKGISSMEFITSRTEPPQEAHSVHTEQSQTAFCDLCETNLLLLSKEELIKLIRLRRFFHAEDHRLYYNPGGEDISASTGTGSRRRPLPADIGED